MANEVTLNDTLDQLEAEEAPSLADVAEETNGGAWPKGWYKATIIEGYSTRKGTQFTTSDDVSKSGDSRNLKVCVKVDKPGEESRNMQAGFNYRVSDLTAERIAFVKEIRAEYKDVRGAWPDKDAQRSSLALAKLGQLEKATFRLKLTPQHTIIAAPFVGQQVDVFVGVDDNGYNEIKQFAPAGTKTGGSKARK